MKIIKIVIHRIKKNMVGYITSFICLLTFSTLVYVAYGKINSNVNVANQSEQPAKKAIILDAGHGGEDGGAVSKSGVVEKDINLSVALMLRDLLETSGYRVIMTRDKDIAIYDESAETLREKKRSDLHNRLDIINQNSNDDNIFVSIHQNKFPDPKYCGTQIFYSKHNPKSTDLANSIKDSVTSFLQPENKREIKEANKKIYLLNNSKLPAIVVECGFLSNPEELEKLADKEYQSEMAFSIYCGILNYFKNDI